MNDHTRLRDGLAPHGELEGSMAAVALATEPAVPAQAPGTGVYAALDLGTNNCRLLIASRWLRRKALKRDQRIQFDAGSL